MKNRRILICLFGGVIAAAICVIGGVLQGYVTAVTVSYLAASVLNRILIGFVIGISGWRINYLLHGAIIGLLVSLVSSLNLLSVHMTQFIMYTGVGVLYGIGIEILATRIFKAPMV